LAADRYNLNKLVHHETRKENQIDVANRFSALAGLEIPSVDDTWVKIRDSIIASANEEIGVLETNRNKLWVDEECSELAIKRKQAKLLCLQNPNDQTVDEFSNVRRDTCRTFGGKTRDYVKAKVNKLEENSKYRDIREMYKGINEFRKGYQPGAYVINKHDGTIVPDKTSKHIKWMGRIL
jgi:hypothetical protein